MEREVASRLAGGATSTDRATSSAYGQSGTVNVRTAKAHLSALLDEVAEGREIVITSGGKPKARLMPIDPASQRRPFTGTREHLRSMPKWRGGPTAEEIVRADRDGRGW